MATTLRQRFAVWVVQNAESREGTESVRALTAGPQGSEEPFKRAAGGWGATQEPYVDLYEHNIWLREQTRWDVSAPFLALGTLGWGGAIGAIAAEITATSTGVLVCLVGGTVAFFCGVALKVQRSRDLRTEYEKFDRRLCLYEHESDVKAIKERLERRAAEQAAEHTLKAKVRRLRENLTQ